MAARLLSRGSRGTMVAYMPSLRGLVQHISRGFCSYDEWHDTQDNHSLEPNILDDIAEPEHKLGPLSPKDSRFPLPGLVGSSVAPPAGLATSAPPGEEPDVLTAPLPHQRHVNMLQQFLSSTELMVEDSEYVLNELPPSPMDVLECRVTDCPKLIKKDFQDLFPGHPFGNSPLTVVTICQKTENDMTAWDTAVEEEREVLLQQFVSGATEICQALQQAGYWADFIDPSSGRPYLSDDFTNATMFEVDERYRHFGFEINDLGCCKVISHHLWGTRAYVGCVFTNAPVDHKVLIEMTQKKDWE